MIKTQGSLESEEWVLGVTPERFFETETWNDAI